MGFVVAIVGRYGVGKSLLCQHFLDQGLSVTDINPGLLDLMQRYPQYALCAACLNAQYEAITDKVPTVSEPDILDLILHQVRMSRSEYAGSVMVLPSFLSLSDLMQEARFDYVVAVDCSRLVQRQYLEGKGLPQRAVKALLDSDYPREYYTKFATDIFLNSVSLNHMEWVARQMLKTFELSSIYK